MMEKLGMGSAEHVPAVILTDAEHKMITAEIKAVRKRLVGEALPTKEQLWKIYQEAYADKPEWLNAIASYFAP